MASAQRRGAACEEEAAASEWSFRVVALGGLPSVVRSLRLRLAWDDCRILLCELTAEPRLEGRAGAAPFGRQEGGADGTECVLEAGAVQPKDEPGVRGQREPVLVGNGAVAAPTASLEWLLELVGNGAVAAPTASLEWLLELIGNDAVAAPTASLEWLPETGDRKAVTNSADAEGARGRPDCASDVALLPGSIGMPES